MAFVFDSIPAPTRRLLRASGPGYMLTSAEVIALTADDLLDEISREIERQESAARRLRTRPQARVHPVRRSPAARTRPRIRS